MSVRAGPGPRLPDSHCSTLSRRPASDLVGTASRTICSKCPANTGTASNFEFPAAGPASTGGGGNEAGARVTLLEGVQMSTDKVINFTTRTDRYDWLFGIADGGPALALESDYIDWFNLDLGAEWDAGTTTDKWNILAMQYFVACYGNGIDPYNFYDRRTFNF